MNKVSPEAKQLIANLLDAHEKYIFQNGGDESHVVVYEAEGKLEALEYLRVELESVGDKDEYHDQ